MAASKLSSRIAMAIAAAAIPTLSTRSYAYGGGGYRFSPFSSSSSAPKDPPSSSGRVETEPEEPRGSGMDPEALERASKALREINSSKNSKQIFDLMRKQEQTRQTELSGEKAHYQAQQSHADIERQRKLVEEQRDILQQESQQRAQVMRYEDELARKRMQTEHGTQRQHNIELVRMQEESSMRKEQARQATEEQIQAQQRQTEKERAELERETIRVKALAEEQKVGPMKQN